MTIQLNENVRNYDLNDDFSCMNGGAPDGQQIEM